MKFVSHVQGLHGFGATRYATPSKDTERYDFVAGRKLLESDET